MSAQCDSGMPNEALLLTVIQGSHFTEALLCLLCCSLGHVGCWHPAARQRIRESMEDHGTFGLPSLEAHTSSHSPLTRSQSYSHIIAGKTEKCSLPMCWALTEVQHCPWQRLASGTQSGQCLMFSYTITYLCFKRQGSSVQDYSLASWLY